ncbi:MAG TPA: phytanoyl-CoA dioxygenase family protein [Candidatus Acidoferrales bacterium]|nr:phytanoyl-CoA dioxygenase family protein [Candidatus Acidoferrales bacterium]
MTTEQMAVQSSELNKLYAQDGFVVAKQIFSQGSLAMLRDALRAVLDKSGSNGFHNESLEDLVLRREAQDHSLVYQASQSVGSSAATYQLLGSSDIFNAISEVTGFRKADLHLLPMYLIIQLPSSDRFDYTWHQDGSYYPWCQDFLTLWFPVNRSTKKDTGTISMIPGSHRYGPRETETFLKHGFFKQIQSKLRDSEETLEHVLEVDLGDCCIMAGNTVHRSVANHSTSPRIAGVLRIANIGTQQTYDRERFYCVHKS